VRTGPATTGSTEPADQHAVLTGSTTRLDVDRQTIVLFNVTVAVV